MYSFFFKCMLTGCLLLNAAALHAQQYPEWHKQLPVKAIELAPLKQPEQTLPVYHITVADQRDDTSCTGYLRRKTGKQMFKLALTPSFPLAVSAFMNSAFYHKPGPDSATVLMVIKKLRLTSELPDKKMNDAFNRKEAGAVALFEFYYKNAAGCYPVCRFDTVVEEKTKADGNETELMETVLLASLYKLMGAACSKAFLQRRPLDEHIVYAAGAKKWTIPLLTGAKPETGVYRSFAEFKQNQPGYRHFSIDTGKRVDMMYVFENDKWLPVYNGVWGFSDGENIFVRSGGNYYLLERCGNTFALKGKKTIFKAVHQPPPVQRATDFSTVGAKGQLLPNTGPPVSSGDVTDRLRHDNNRKEGCYLLDMETGQIY